MRVSFSRLLIFWSLMQRLVYARLLMLYRVNLGARGEFIGVILTGLGKINFLSAFQGNENENAGDLWMCQLIIFVP